jgi:hypothetical protein
MDRLDRLESKLDRVTESVIRTEEQLALIHRVVLEHDARTVKAVESAQHAHRRVDSLEVLFTVPFRWLKVAGAVAGALTAVWTAWKLLGK